MVCFYILPPCIPIHSCVLVIKHQDRGKLFWEGCIFCPWGEFSQGNIFTIMFSFPFLVVVGVGVKDQPVCALELFC